MNNRTTLLIVIIAVALALLVIFLEHDVSTVPYQSPERFRIFRGLKQASVERVSLLARGDMTVHLTRSSDRWFFDRPLPDTDGYSIKWEADPEAVNRLVDTLVALREADAAIKPAPGARLDTYGLGNLNEAERVEVSFDAENGARIKRKLYLGDAVPGSAGRMYVRLEGDDRVLVVEDTLGQMMSMAREGGIVFRSRRVFPRSDLAETDEVELVTGAYEAGLKRVAANLWTVAWRDTADARTYRARGSNELIGNLGAAMQELRVERFVADTVRAEDFTRYGLVKPRVKITFTLSSQSGGLLNLLAGPDTADLRIGNEVEGAPDQVYAVAQRLPMVFTIAKSFLDKLPKTGKNLPARKLVSIASAAVKAITLENATGKLRASKEKWDWKLLAPMRIDGDTAAIDALVKAVTTTDCEDVIWEGRLGLRDFGLTAPSATLTLFHEVGDESGGKRRLTEKIQFGRVFEKNDATAKQADAKDETKGSEEKPTAAKRIYVRRVGDTAVRIFDQARFEAVVNSPLHFINKQVLEFDAFQTETFTFTRPDGRYAFVKQGQDWMMTAPAALKADAAHVGGLVSSISWLSAAEIVAVSADKLAAYGLDQPTHRLEMVVQKKSDDAAKTPTSEAAPPPEKEEEKKKEKEQAEKTEEISLILAVKQDGEKTLVYGHVPGTKLIFRLEDGFAEKLDAEPADTDIFPFQWNIREARTVFADRTVRLTRDADGNVYRVAEGADAELRAADAEAGRKFFESLGGTKVQKRYLAYESKNLVPYGLDQSPHAAISSKDKEEQTITLEVGAAADAAKHGEGLRYARRKGQTAVFLVKQSDLDALLQPASAFLAAAEDSKAEAGKAGPPAPPGKAGATPNKVEEPAKPGGAEEPAKKTSAEQSRES